ncbi:hypothetical protein [Nitrosomonas sp.]|uniref:hypothetical protein n=1 Tax=Nitrosomonas sp. TaxID=42353 RepID=UPI00374C9CA5
MEKAGAPRVRQQLLQKRKKMFYLKAMETQLVSRSDLMGMEDRLIKWSVGLALGQVAVIAALVKLLYSEIFTLNC